MNKALSTVIIIYLLAGLVLMPKMCIDAAAQGLVLCLNVIIPSLFPFFVCSKVLVSNGFAEFAGRPFKRIMRPLFNVPPCGAFAFVIGILSGSPVGAKTVAQMYNESQCTKAEAQRMLCFCNNCGPTFILGSVATGLLGFKQIGALLYASHVLSAVLIGVIMSGYKRKEILKSAFSHSKTATRTTFPQAVAEAVTLTGYVCGFVIFFSVAVAIFKQSGIVEILTHHLEQKSVARGVIYGMLEMTNGAACLANGGVSALTLCAISFVTGFGGLSVILQVSGIISEYGFSTFVFAVAKLVQGIISAIITYVMLAYAKIELPVFDRFSAISAANLWAFSIKVFGLFGIIILFLSILNITGKILRRM